jgi:hypothetical protein
MINVNVSTVICREHFNRYLRRAFQPSFAEPRIEWRPLVETQRPCNEQRPCNRIVALVSMYTRRVEHLAP